MTTPQRTAASAATGGEDRLIVSSPMFDTQEHFPIPVDKDGNGPAEYDETVLFKCWCSIPECRVTQAFTSETQNKIIEIMNRSNDVREWPEDEIELHRLGHSKGSDIWLSFTQRREALMELRARKIAELVLGLD